MSNLPDLYECTICIIGLGYVGLPLAIEFGTPQSNKIKGKFLNRKVIGFDIKKERVAEINLGKDLTNEVDKVDILKADYFEATTDENRLIEADVFIVTVPTPVDKKNKPDLSFLKNASLLVGKTLEKRKKILNRCTPVVIYESTVFPGATEEICIPIIENKSKLKLNSDSLNSGFYCGYSPERINPGDKKHRISQIVKVTSGSNTISADWINKFYASIILAGTFKASSIKVAEAAKVIENTQRDINIALVNELSIIFKKMGVDTLDVLEAAGTKWNFLPFKPGLVGGHCIGVDPYYLTYKSEQIGYKPELLLAGRDINNSMPLWIVNILLDELKVKNLILNEAKILMLGLTFKENCPDIRNSKVFDIIDHLSELNMHITLHDPYIDEKNILGENCKYKISKNIPYEQKFDALIVSVRHNEFINLSNKEWKSIIPSTGIIIDIKSIVPREFNPIRI